MEDNFIAVELENIDRYFDEEALVESKDAASTRELADDQWTAFLNAYMCNNQDEMARCIGKVSLTDWCEEEKLWWNILLASKCSGSNLFIRELMRKLREFQHNNKLIEVLLTDVGKLLLDRETAIRYNEYDKVYEDFYEKEKKTSEARANLNAHRNG